MAWLKSRARAEIDDGGWVVSLLLSVCPLIGIETVSRYTDSLPLLGGDEG
jgi:hypothetical protein